MDLNVCTIKLILSIFFQLFFMNDPIFNLINNNFNKIIIGSQTNMLKFNLINIPFHLSSFRAFFMRYIQLWLPRNA